MFADLHLHTSFSDGTYTPNELARQAHRRNLAVIALTDHDTVEGCPATGEACGRLGIEFIPATEMTAEIHDVEIHILGYGLDVHNPALLEAMNRFQQVRQDRIREMVRRLNSCGVSLKAEKVFALANCRSPGRPHVGRALVEAGFCSSVDEAFQRFLKRGQPAWAPKFKMTARQAIQLIHSAGGLAVLAHPGLNRVDHFLPELIRDGLDGLECYHSRHTARTAEHYVQLCHEHDLLITGGSDCHGMNKGQPLIGTVKLPYAHVEALMARLDHRRELNLRTHGH